MVLLDHHKLAVAHDGDDAIAAGFAEIVEDDWILETLETTQGQDGFFEVLLFGSPGQRFQHDVGYVKRGYAAKTGFPLKPTETRVCT